MDRSSLIDLHKTTWSRLAGKLDRLPHALLIHGAPGLGKLDLAERFAQLLLCEKRREGNLPCGACESCRWSSAFNHPDVRYVEPEVLLQMRYPEADEEAEEEGRKKRNPSLQIRIHQTRGLADFVNLASHRGGRRVAILHPAEVITEDAATALLKMLEEPPPGALFLLVSHRPSALLATIRSRCVPVPVPLPAPRAAAQWLEAQGVKDAARWLAFAGGAPLRALEYATGPRGAAIERARQIVAARDAAAVGDRDLLEPLVELLQKTALDRAFSVLCGAPKYAPAPRGGALGGAGGGRAAAGAWLAYARAMGQHRLLARHPLNPKLLAADMLAGLPPE